MKNDIEKAIMDGYVNYKLAQRRQVKMMDMNIIKMINNNMQILTDAQRQAGIMYESKEMRDWQWELMLRNETESENWD